MRTMLLAAASALALGVAAPAFAGDGGDMPATTRFTMIADAQAHQLPVQQSYAAGQASTQVNVARTHSLGTWLFAPAQGNGQN